MNDLPQLPKITHQRRKRQQRKKKIDEKNTTMKIKQTTNLLHTGSFILRHGERGKTSKFTAIMLLSHSKAKRIGWKKEPQ